MSINLNDYDPLCTIAVKRVIDHIRKARIAIQIKDLDSKDIAYWEGYIAALENLLKTNP